MWLAFALVTALYLGLATFAVGGPDSRVPPAALIAVGFERGGRDATALLAVAAAVRIVRGRERAASGVALAAMAVVAAFSGPYALVPAAVALCSKTSTRKACVMPTRS
jgi:hypothetical protein